MELEAFEKYNSIIGIVFLFTILLVFVGGLLALIGQMCKPRTKVYLETIGVAFFVLFFFVVIFNFVASTIFSHKVKKEFDAFLSSKDLEVFVDGKLLIKEDANSLVKNLIYMYNAGGNRPTQKKWNVTFKSGTKEYNINLVRAQSDSLLYYLYINNYESLVTIGTIRTKVLTKYPKEKLDE